MQVQMSLKLQCLRPLGISSLFWLNVIWSGWDSVSGLFSISNFVANFFRHFLNVIHFLGLSLSHCYVPKVPRGLVGLRRAHVEV